MMDLHVRFWDRAHCYGIHRAYAQLLDVSLAALPSLMAPNDHVVLLSHSRLEVHSWLQVGWLTLASQTLLSLSAAILAVKH
jgi:hypothetical protein